MRRTAVVLSVVMLLVLSVTLPAPALADTSMQCDQPASTIQSLQDCVNHAYDMGHIDSLGIRDSLLAKLQAAQVALDQGLSRAATGTLQAFIREVEAQAGKQIMQDHAEHMIMHAQMVIQSLGG